MQNTRACQCPYLHRNEILVELFVAKEKKKKINKTDYKPLVADRLLLSIIIRVK